jgi:hypothetical protein
MGRLFDGQRILMRAEGLEPPRAGAHQVLSLARLPVSPRPLPSKDRARLVGVAPAAAADMGLRLTNALLLRGSMPGKSSGAKSARTFGSGEGVALDARRYDESPSGSSAGVPGRGRLSAPPLRSDWCGRSERFLNAPANALRRLENTLCWLPSRPVVRRRRRFSEPVVPRLRGGTTASVSAPGGVEPPHAASKAAALSAELRGHGRNRG